MNSIWLSLLWKEWREYRWKLAALTTFVLLVVAVSILIALETSDRSYFWEVLRNFLNFYSIFMLAYGFLAGFFLSMSVAAKENGDGTSPFLHSLPTSGWTIGSAKLLIASLTAILPIVVGTIISYFFVGFYFVAPTEFQESFLPSVSEFSSEGENTEYLLRLTISAVMFVLSILWWSSAIGANQSDEIRAGAIAFLGMLIIWMLYTLSFSVSVRLRLNVEPYLSKLFAFGPAGPLFLFDSSTGGGRLPVPSLSAYVSPIFISGHLTAAAWFLYRFGKWRPARTGKGEVTAVFASSQSNLKPPFASQLEAIVWKQFFETGPLAVLGLAGALALSLLGYWIDDSSVTKFSDIFLPVAASLSFLVVMVAGIGLFLEELRPGISDFWRSRPLELRLWFATKYCTGITVLVLFLGVPALLAGLYLLRDWNELFTKDYLLMGSLLVWVYVMIYSLTMLYQCLLRQPIYAAILALGTFWLGAILTSWFDRYTDLHWSVWLFTIVALWAGTVYLTWKAVYHNWGWRT